ncbi:MAG: inositol monophosphatase family protein [Bacteroidales bacterium]|nr:inositol monophosphatase family protein [Bacteroidales bacterium]
MPYKEICFSAMEAVKKAAAYVREQHENRADLTIEVKGRQNFVTEVDKKAEEILVSELSDLLPEAGFIAEEGTASRQGDRYNWVIDPVDGTTNFIHGVFPFAISLGLTEYGEVVAGIIYEFGLDEFFYAWKNGGAWLNGSPVRVSAVDLVDQALIATGFPYTNFKYLEQFMRSMEHFMKNSHGLRRLGSAATDMAYVACGRYDAFYEYGLHPWDVAAGILLVKEAGGVASDFTGQGDPLFGEHLVCSNQKIFKEFQSVIQKIMLSP